MQSCAAVISPNSSTRFAVDFIARRYASGKRIFRLWTGNVTALLLGLMVITLAGCEIPAQLVWSPDGALAAYRCGNSAYLVDEQGNVLRELGSSMGGFVWSGDSKALYFAATDEEPNPPTRQNRQWMQPADTQATSNPASTAATGLTTAPATADANAPNPPPVEEPGNIVSINVLRDGKVESLFRIAGASVWHLQLSPDGQWLAAMTSMNKSGESNGPQENRLLVYSISAGHLYTLSRFCGIGACFTGPAQLAFVEPNGVDAVGQLAGRLVEVTLDDTSATLERRALLDALVPSTRWLEACDGGLMFSAVPQAYPAKPSTDAAQTMYKLYHFSRADRGLTVLADDVGEFFDASPDGKRILFEKLTQIDPPAMSRSTQPSTGPTTAPAKVRDELCVMNANGSDPHVLRALDDYPGDPKPPMWPAWRGTDQITFISHPDVAQTVHIDDKDRKVYDVLLYHLTDKGELDPVSTLSGDWKPELKPYSKIEEKPATQP